MRPERLRRWLVVVAVVLLCSLLRVFAPGLECFCPPHCITTLHSVFGRVPAPPRDSSSQLRGRHCKLAATLRNPTEAVDPNFTFEVVVVGGGAVGLCLALFLCAKLRGGKRIRVYDSRWNRAADGTVCWREAHPGHGRTVEVVTLQSNAWAELPSDVKERLFAATGVVEQWPLQLDSPSSSGHPRNVALSELEDCLLEMLQDMDYKEEVELVPAAYDEVQHQTLVSENPFHALVLADGPEVLWARDELLGKGSLCPPVDVLAVSVQIEEDMPSPNVAECTLLSLAQNEYVYTMRDDKSGVVSVKLSAEDVQQLPKSLPPDTVMPVGLLHKSKLWVVVQDGLRLFGIGDGAARSVMRLRSTTSERDSHVAELQACRTPMQREVMAHPFAFLLGAAADSTIRWHGHGLSTSIRVASSLAEQLSCMRQSLAAGWLSQDTAVSQFDMTMLPLHLRAASDHMRQIRKEEGAVNPTPARRSGTASSWTSDKATFLTAVKDSRMHLAQAGLSEQHASKLPSSEALEARISALEIHPCTFARFRRGGSWRLKKPSVAQAKVHQPSAGAQVMSEVPDIVIRRRVKNAAAWAQIRSDYNAGVRLLKGKGVTKDVAQAASFFLKAASENHPDAQYALGVMLMKGTGMPPDLPKAAFWIQQAASNGHAKAQYNMGIMTQYGHGAELNPEVANYWMIKAARQGHRQARISCERNPDINCFGSGPWLDLDPKVLGVSHMLKEAEAGDIYAQHRLGLMYYNGECVDEDRAKAGYWIMQAAQKGLAEAQYLVAGMLFNGDGVEKDEPYAFKFYRLAAENGHALSQHNLGGMYHTGKGVHRDLQQAAYWWEQAANKGVAQSQNHIGWLLYSGQGVPQDIHKAHRFFELAAAGGDPEALWNLKHFDAIFI